MEDLNRKTFEKWYSFYKLINNKTTLNESDTTLAIMRINFAIEEFLDNKKQLIEILRFKGILNFNIAEQKSTYTGNARMFIRENIDLEKGSMNNDEFNRYIFNIISNIVYENIDIYLEFAENILGEDENRNINIADEVFDEGRNLIKKIIKILYLFRNSERENTRVGDIYGFLKLTINNTGEYIDLSKLSKILLGLEKNEFIHLDFSGNYSIISEDKKKIKELISIFLKEITIEEKNEYVCNLIKEEVYKVVNCIGEENIKTCIDIDGDKIFRLKTDYILKIDNYSKENRDIRRGYYVLNTKMRSDILFWYGKRIIDLDDKVKYVMAYKKAIDGLNITYKKDREKLDFIKEQTEIFERTLKELKLEIEDGFKTGGYIYGGEDKKVESFTSITELFKSLIEKFN